MNQNSIKQLLLLSLVLFFILTGCKTINRLGSTDLSFIYDEEQNEAEMKAVAYHENDSLSKLYYEFSYDGLLYQKPGGNWPFTANFILKYILYPSYEQGLVLDSSSIQYVDTSHYGSQQKFSSNFTVKAPYPGDYLLKLILLDVNRNQERSLLLPLNKKTAFNAQNYLILDKDSTIIFDNFIGPSSCFRIASNDLSLDSMIVYCYFREFPVALPPYSTSERDFFSYKPDSVFSVGVNNGATSLLKLEKEGFYQFKKNEKEKDGFTVFRFYEGFPKVNTASQMYSPLRYITNNKEFKHLSSQNKKRIAVENFWINNAGNIDRAAEMIKDYYSAVEMANKLFSSYHEGWKTDRGMIYIVFGRPSIVYRSSNMEEWIYGEEGNFMSVRFRFVKLDNPFTDNDYMLEKLPDYREIWYLAVKSWRR